MKCLFLDIEMPKGDKCPVPFNKDGLICDENCSCADDPEIINARAEAWEKFKKDMIEVEKLTTKVENN